ncbi:ABC transporter substrate-binding protein [Kibdelosporangium persicum]|uniref:Periplasmic substrate-binding component of ABC-type dipeptide/oligopeptide transport system n=1 Tax=Kibdelosporangium persicum TaxID=2698649 RepID=A0ABX2F7J6_9PSEU|nr:ABC transporter substrate-binding protein [Kibdelosporangium persicum]NRN66935.1 Periplasmic substrate-binding component of ABC-type dipeptide/oligopeptide transport system [Kibdelosporangium persicum]
MFLRRRLTVAVIGLTAITLAATACSQSPPAGGPVTDTLVVYSGQSGDYQQNLNPYSPSVNEGPGTIFEPLFFFNLTSRDAPPVPLLGTRYAWNGDGTELSITLRDNVKWSDGQPFTAKDVVFTFDMVRGNPSMNNTGFQGETTAVDDRTVTVRFPAPAYMEEPQVLGKLFIVPEHLWKSIPSPANDVIAKPVGTGPYVLEDFKPQAFTLKANPSYWGGEPAVKKVRYLSLSGNQAGADALQAGTIDWQTSPVPDVKNTERIYPGYRALVSNINQITLFSCSNTQLGCQGPQTDPAVRKAIYYAINRGQLNALAFQGTAGDISPGLALPDRDRDIVSGRLRERIAPANPEVGKSGQLLTGAGYAKGADGIYAKDGKPLALTVKVVAGWTDYITAVDTMAQQLQQAGIKLTPQQVSYNEWADARGRGQYELLIDSLTPGPAPDPFYVFSYFFSTATTAPVGQTANPNFSRFSDPAVDNALAELKKIAPSNQAARQPHYETIQTALESAMPCIPVLTNGTVNVYNAKEFTGWPSKEDMYAFPAVWQRPDQAQVFKRLKPAGA